MVRSAALVFLMLFTIMMLGCASQPAPKSASDQIAPVIAATTQDAATLHTTAADIQTHAAPVAASADPATAAHGKALVSDGAQVESVAVSLGGTATQAKAAQAAAKVEEKTITTDTKKIASLESHASLYLGLYTLGGLLIAGGIALAIYGAMSGGSYLLGSCLAAGGVGTIIITGFLQDYLGRLEIALAIAVVIGIVIAIYKATGGAWSLAGVMSAADSLLTDAESGAGWIVTEIKNLSGDVIGWFKHAPPPAVVVPAPVASVTPPVVSIQAASAAKAAPSAPVAVAVPSVTTA